MGMHPLLHGTGRSAAAHTERINSPGAEGGCLPEARRRAYLPSVSQGQGWEMDYLTDQFWPCPVGVRRLLQAYEGGQ